jgi:hypothetical protein
VGESQYYWSNETYKTDKTAKSAQSAVFATNATKFLTSGKRVDRWGADPQNISIRLGRFAVIGGTGIGLKVDQCAEILRVPAAAHADCLGVAASGRAYSLQANAKTLEDNQHPDRNAQFEYVNARIKSFLAQGLPVISVDTKMKELVKNFSNRGQEWQPQGEPQKTLVHDFPDKELCKIIPYGIYDVGRNQGWVSVGTEAAEVHTEGTTPNLLSTPMCALAPKNHGLPLRV